MTAPDVHTVRQLATEHILEDARRGHGLAPAVLSHHGPDVLSRHEYGAWCSAIREAIRTAQIAVSWPDEQQPAEATGGNLEVVWLTQDDEGNSGVWRDPADARQELMNAWAVVFPGAYKWVNDPDSTHELLLRDDEPTGLTLRMMLVADAGAAEATGGAQAQDGAASEVPPPFVTALTDKVLATMQPVVAISVRHLLASRSVWRAHAYRGSADRDALAARVAELEGEREADTPHQGLTEDAFVQLLSERSGQPMLICIGDSRPIAGGLYGGAGIDHVEWGVEKKQIGRVTIPIYFPDDVITGPTPENEARRQQLLAELNATEAEDPGDVPCVWCHCDGCDECTGIHGVVCGCRNPVQR